MWKISEVYLNQLLIVCCPAIVRTDDHSAIDEGGFDLSVLFIIYVMYN